MIGPLFMPPTLTIPGGKQGTVQRPSLGGAANWEGAALDPETNILYIPSRDSYHVVHFYTPQPGEGGSVDYTHGGRGANPQGPQGLPLFKPPYSRMTAIDLDTGE